MILSRPTRKILQFIKLELLWLKLSYTFRLAHHPLCSRYSSQVFKIGNIHLCQGCTIIVLSLLFSFLFFLFFSSLIAQATWITTIASAIVGIIPTVAIDSIAKSRHLKRFARFTIGVALGYGISIVFFHPEILLKIVASGFVIIFWILYIVFRKRAPAKDLCINCPYLPDKPTCYGLTKQIAANRTYSREAYVILESDIHIKLDKLRSKMEKDAFKS